jgi:hypothetical protein
MAAVEKNIDVLKTEMEVMEQQASHRDLHVILGGGT